MNHGAFQTSPSSEHRFIPKVIHRFSGYVAKRWQALHQSHSDALDLKDDLRTLLRPSADDVLTVWPVGRAVSIGWQLQSESWKYSPKLRRKGRPSPIRKARSNLIEIGQRDGSLGIVG